MEFILITNDLDTAKYAQDCGVHRIMVDLETRGKFERQGHLNTLISGHCISDIEKIRNGLTTSKLQVRVNPINKDSESEINQAVNSGADILMLPMFENSNEVAQFISFIDNRAASTLLLETAASLVRIDDILDSNKVDEVHIGLNDLHLQLNLQFMFEALSGGIIDYLADKIHSRNINFGFGGIARLGHGLIDSTLILSEHRRLNSEVVILSRDFTNVSNNAMLRNEINLEAEIKKINDYNNLLSEYSQELLINNKKILAKLVREIVDSKLR